jgi:hypothetical protein
MDEKAEGWAQKINKERLSLSDPYCCIIAQGTGSFYKNRDSVIEADGVRFSVRMLGYGFAAGYLAHLWALILSCLTDDEVEPPSPRRLEMAWVYQIDKRLAAMPAPG